MTENHNDMLFEHLRMVREHLFQLPLWRMMLYTMLFVFTDGNVLLFLFMYWAIKDIIRCFKELKKLNKELKELKKELKELKELEKSDEIWLC